ncbi:TIGR04500 family putative peptide maturation system protein [Streptosporangium sp. NBC_01755]|uniref:TIGR04500 family putative peptide maturation system protein n=1 Tax=Streptosporangium sp. NBC_01755 TaxID=2975949 RepID=UPI002DD8EA8F|nr:TIGR04500 family putative peptide maturation system protein [Streptosporangium sp. NBC_01755]WSD02059.1 TIGR04500 family putative peptide maturation system protein [Streptosporangium sp. NBC_01755]
MTDFAKALQSGASLLRTLPRRSVGVADAHRAVGEWAARHPEIRAQLVVDRRPGTPVVDYDLLLDHPDGGTVALTAPPEDGVPWLIDHSTHWAAGYLVSVNDVDVTVPQALTMLRSLSRRDASPYQEIVDQCLLVEAVDETEPLTSADLQATADEFRRGRGLHDRESTLAWMTDAGMSGEQFEAYITGIARRRRFRRDKEAELAPGHLAANPGDFARVRAVWVTGKEKVTAGTAADLLAGLTSLGETALTSPGETALTSPGEAATPSIGETAVTSIRESATPSIGETAVTSIRESATPSIGETAVTSIRESATPSIGETAVTSIRESATPSIGETAVTFATRWEADLPEALRDTAPGQVIGPVELPGGDFLTGAVLLRSPASDDPETLAAAGRAAFTGWLAERRAAATVEWHWS